MTNIKEYLKRKQIESEIRHAEWAIKFYTETEQKRRTELNHLTDTGKHRLISSAKKRRKIAQNDLDYWKKQLEELLSK